MLAIKSSSALLFHNKISTLYTYFIVAWLVVLFLLFNSRTVTAEPVTVVTEYLPPYQVKNADNSLGGYATEVIQALFDITKDQANIQVLPWVRAYDIALHQENILIYSMTRSTSRESLFHWIGALDIEQYYFWGLKRNFSQTAPSLDALRDISIASANGYASDQFLTEHKFTNIYRVVKEQQIIQMLKRGRVKLVLSDGFVFETLVKELGYELDDFIQVFPVFSLGSEMSIAASKASSTRFIAKYQNAFAQLESSGALFAIKQKWGINNKDKKNAAR